VLGNGNIQTQADCEALMAATGVDGVMSAESLLADPALFSPRRAAPGGEFGPLEGCHLMLEYLDLVDLYPTPWRMVKGHAFHLLGALRCAVLHVGTALGEGCVLRRSARSGC
jgi:tRNA-dihydrouridine synthase 1